MFEDELSVGKGYLPLTTVKRSEEVATVYQKGEGGWVHGLAGDERGSLPV